MLCVSSYTWIPELGDPSIVICIVIVNYISVIHGMTEATTGGFL